MIEVRDLHAGYGRITVLQGCTLDVRAGEVVGILGHNGMGKSTLLKALTGLLPTTSGTVRFDGRDVTGLPAHARARLGIGYVPQGRRIFQNLTVLENLRFAAVAKGRPEAVERVLGEFPELCPLLERRGGTLSGGEQQLLALARALCGEPRLLLLDEPSEGIQPSIVQALVARVAELKASRGLTVLLVEQNLGFIRDLAERVLVLRRGRVVGEVGQGALDDAALMAAITG